ncbi:hypothetical protein NEIMUCOT_04078 [Neisseria mucosa ATCC 25996]|uniref:Uncharacterized protein n=1 Tax=Neisseria mucosa (strain ATCC 25996 / DSM 4631 / NCTC 10774 / M26) TaxID=546266 RepID=D2ZTZ0_NEIM2|nr:hypothetical protein NEIMUCOT_04078 [Neisseria mucosa ATCC 25996]
MRIGIGGCPYFVIRQGLVRKLILKRAFGLVKTIRTGVSFHF